MLRKLTLLTMALVACGTVSIGHAKTYYGQTTLSDQKGDSMTIFGPAQLDKVKVDTLSVTGALTFKKLEVTKKTEAIGPVKGDEGMLGDLTATGPTKLEHCKINALNVTGPLNVSFVAVSDKATIIGPLEATDSQFGDVTITADDISLTNSSVKNIEIKKIDGQDEQVLELIGSTIISGNVTFESGKGKVIVEKTAKIQGKVDGGTTSVASESDKDKGSDKGSDRD